MTKPETEQEIACVFCGKVIISKHFKTYLCDECYKDHNTEKRNIEVTTERIDKNLHHGIYGKQRRENK